MLVANQVAIPIIATHLASLMGDRGLLVANNVNRRRAKLLASNLEIVKSLFKFVTKIAKRGALHDSLCAFQRSVRVEASDEGKITITRESCP